MASREGREWDQWCDSLACIHAKRLKIPHFLFGFLNIRKRNHVLTHGFAETWKIQIPGETWKIQTYMAGRFL